MKLSNILVVGLCLVGVGCAKKNSNQQVVAAKSVKQLSSLEQSLQEAEQEVNDSMLAAGKLAEYTGANLNFANEESIIVDFTGKYARDIDMMNALQEDRLNKAKIVAKRLEKLQGIFFRSDVAIETGSNTSVSASTVELSEPYRTIRHNLLLHTPELIAQYEGEKNAVPRYLNLLQFDKYVEEIKALIARKEQLIVQVDTMAENLRTIEFTNEASNRLKELEGQITLMNGSIIESVGLLSASAPKEQSFYVIDASGELNSYEEVAELVDLAAADLSALEVEAAKSAQQSSTRAENPIFDF